MLNLPQSFLKSSTIVPRLSNNVPSLSTNPWIDVCVSSLLNHAVRSDITFCSLSNIPESSNLTKIVLRIFSIILSKSVSVLSLAAIASNCFCSASLSFPPTSPIFASANTASYVVSPSACDCAITAAFSLTNLFASSTCKLVISAKSSADKEPSLNPCAIVANSGLVRSKLFPKSLNGAPLVAINSFIASSISGLPPLINAKLAFICSWTLESMFMNNACNLLSVLWAFNSSAACFLDIPVILASASSCII